LLDRKTPVQEAALRSVSEMAVAGAHGDAHRCGFVPAAAVAVRGERFVNPHRVAFRRVRLPASWPRPWFWPRRHAAQAAGIAAGELLKETQDAVDTGTVLAVRVMQARAAVLETQQANLTLEVQIDDATVEFNELLGLPLETEPILAPVEQPSPVAPLEDYLRNAKAFRCVRRVTSVVSVAREALRLAKDQFELGLSGRAAYEEANAAALAAEADLAAAEYQLEVAIADLDRLSGSR
jgi:hypothetical protein